MKFIKGFIITIAVYFGLSFLFLALATSLAGGDISALFSSPSSIASIFYTSLASPGISTSIQAAFGIGIIGIDVILLYIMLYAVTPALAAILGSLAERKSNTLKHIFSATWLGLMTPLAIGVIIQVVAWDQVALFGVLGYTRWQWFLPGTLIMGAIMAFFWCSIGLLIIRKKWD